MQNTTQTHCPNCKCKQNPPVEKAPMQQTVAVPYLRQTLAVPYLRKTVSVR